MRDWLRLRYTWLAAALSATIAMSVQACAPTTVRPAANPDASAPDSITQDAVFETAIAPQPDEDLQAPCKYELTLTNPSRRAQGVWVIFERSRDMLLYYRDADVRRFARRHDLALLYPFHCQSKSPETQEDMKVDPGKGLGRALFAALSELAQTSGHLELASARLILLGFSGTGSLVGRLAEYAPERVLAVNPTDPDISIHSAWTRYVFRPERLSAAAKAVPQPTSLRICTSHESPRVGPGAEILTH